MTRVTPGFSNVLPPATLDAWVTRFDRAFASRAPSCTVSHGRYPFTVPYVGTMAFKVDADTTARLKRHRQAPGAVGPDAPVMTLSFSHPVRLAKDFMPAWDKTPGARWVCGEYGVAVKSIVLHGNGAVTVHGDSGRVVSWTLFGLKNAWNTARYWGYAAPPAVDADFFAQVVDTLMLPRAPSEPGTPASSDDGMPPTPPPARGHDGVHSPVGNLALSTQIRGLNHFCARASGDLRRVVAEYPIGRAIAENKLFSALVPPMKAAAGTAPHASIAYRLDASAVLRDGTVGLHAAATPPTPRSPAWEMFFKIADPQQPGRRLLQGMALAVRPSRLPARSGAQCPLPVGSAPLAALVHGFEGVEAMARRPQPQPVPTLLPAAPQPLPKSVEDPLVGMLERVHLSARAEMRAGTYSTAGQLPGSRLTAPVDGRFEFDVETLARNPAGQVRLQSARLRWTGAEPLVWRIGFTNFVLGAAVGRFLDRIFSVRVRGLSADADGNLQVDGDLYMLGLRLCKVDTLRDWAARRWPEDCPSMRAETDVAGWLQGMYLWPEVPMTNDELWHLWRDIQAMTPTWQWDLRPMASERMRADTGPQTGIFSTEGMRGDVALTEDGDVTLNIAADADAAAAFAFDYENPEIRIAGAWSAHVTKRMFPYPEGTPEGIPAVDETRIDGHVRVRLDAPTHADVRVGFGWAAADPDALRASLHGEALVGESIVAGEVQGVGRFRETPVVAGAPAFALEYATWKLAHDWAMSNFTIAAGEGGFFTHLTPRQRLRLTAMRASARIASGFGASAADDS